MSDTPRARERASESDMSWILKPAGKLDDRFRAAGPARRFLRHVFPDHWSFLLGEIALYCFIILILTGIFLTLFFKPSMTDIIYHGSYTKLNGVKMSEAYASTLNITFDIRGGLLIRQIHHWAALLFVAAIAAHVMRLFFTGAFRRPRELNWVIGTIMFALAVAEGFCGYSLPDDLLSGTGVRIAEGIFLSIPVVGTYLMFFLWGGQYPGHDFIPRLYVFHILLIPGLLAALITAHLFFIWHQGHTQWPGKTEREGNEHGVPLFPVFMAKTGALFMFVFGILALLGAIAQINPIWLYGPYDPTKVSIDSQPDWYVGWLEGSLRLMPNWITNVGGHTFAWNVFLPAVVLPILSFVLLAFYPFFEEWAVGDPRHHYVLDRPRNAANRTALGAAVVAVAGDLLLAGGDDVIAYHFDIAQYDLVWVLRGGFFLFPLIAFFVARYWCLALQLRDQRKLAAGIETGLIRELTGGGYAPVTKPVPEEQRAVLDAHRPLNMIAPIPRHIIPLPTPRRVQAQIRTRLNHFYTRYRLETNSGEDGQGRMEKPGPDGTQIQAGERRQDKSARDGGAPVRGADRDGSGGSGR
jgi:ubiquinol-cytochrome c reductase cytochrome b subunit